MDRSRRRITFRSSSAEESVAIGRQIALSLSEGEVVCLFGDLGAGKTTLIKGIVAALTSTEPEEVCSPTFSYLAIYEGECPVYHFDLYRLKNGDAFLSLGFEEFLFGRGVCCLEWSERIEEILPEGHVTIRMKHAAEGVREIIVDFPQRVSQHSGRFAKS